VEQPDEPRPTRPDPADAEPAEAASTDLAAVDAGAPAPTGRLARLRGLLGHRRTRQARTAVRRTVIIASVILAVAFVTTISVDLGPAVKGLAERQGSRFLNRELTIGRLSIRLARARFEFDDLRISGPTPKHPPFLTAKRITVSMFWSTLLNRRIVIDAIEMTDWRMVVESFPGNVNTFPSFPRPGGGGQRRFTTTVQWVRAHRGEFVYTDHAMPWSVVTRRLDVTVKRDEAGNRYVGESSFSNGRVTMQQYEPFGVAMRAYFAMDGARVVFDRIDLLTDGARTVLRGDTVINHWPEMMYEVRSTIDFPTQKAIWFAKDNFRAFGTGEFVGTWHMFKETMPDGQMRTGRELKGEIRSALAGVNSLRFPNFVGQVRWVPERLAVTDATADFYGGRLGFDYQLAGMGRPGVRSRHTFDAELQNVDLTALSRYVELQGIQLAGRLSGRNVLEWPSGRFADRSGNGRMRVVPPSDTTLMSRTMPLAAIAARTASGPPFGPFSNHTPRAPVPIGGEIAYAFGPDWLDLAPGQLASPHTYVAFEGRTAFGSRSRIPFHVSSADWQESDREFAGILTAFGSPTNAIPIGGYGTFDGVMLGEFRRPRFEGEFAAEEMRAFDVVWGSVRGQAVIENSYADVTSAVIRSGASTIETSGRFSLGFPRRDGGDEIEATVRIANRPVLDLRQAFGIEDYDVDGLLSGEFRVYGKYTTPLGAGTMTIADGVAYGESFERARANLRFEGNGVRLEAIQIAKSGGAGTGSAFVGWNGTYSFTLDAKGIPLESVDAVRRSGQPLSGLLEFNAGGSGSFSQPKYRVSPILNDLFVADEGIGRAFGTIDIDGTQLTARFEVASPRLTVSGVGQVALTPEMDADLTFSVTDTSLDPYVRAFEPRLSPYTTARASGTIRVVGQLTNIDELVVDATIDRLDAQLFDYELRNGPAEPMVAGAARDVSTPCVVRDAPAGSAAVAGDRRPIRIRLDRHELRIVDMRLVGDGTQLDVCGTVGLHDERIAVTATGDANLAVLQGFIPDIHSSGRAILKAGVNGPMRDPTVDGTFTVDNGRIRHFALPHALENIRGPLRFDSRGVTLDGVTARFGVPPGGDVTFGGRIDKDGYLPGRIDVTMNGRNMRLRLGDGLTAYVNADLGVQGTMQAIAVTGDVTVLEGSRYRTSIDTSVTLLDLASNPVAAGPPQPASVAALPVRFDVRIVAPSTLQVEGTNINVVASADLQLVGTYARPLLLGRAEVVRGDIRFEGKRYIVTRGSIDFNNPTRIEPFFDVEAEVRARAPGETYRITVRVTGTPARNTLDFEADPPLPDADVIALLFGDVAPGDTEVRQFSQGDTATQELVRQRVTRAFTDILASPVDRAVEETFRLDTFQVTPQVSLTDPGQQASRFEPGARLTVGKSVSGRVYLYYSRSLTATARDQVIVLEYDQNDRLSWIFTRNEDGTYSLDVRLRNTF
jgi:hypothetical protein